MPKDLPNDYYHTNFRTLIDCVAERYWDLLSVDEQSFYLKFQQLSLDAQKLLIRLIGRAGRSYRVSKLDYSEIGAIERSVEELVACGFITMDPPADVEILAALYNKTELAFFMGERKLAKMARNALVRAFSEDTRAIEAAVSQAIATLTVDDRFQTYRLLFFGNWYHDMTDFVLTDLGLYRFEQYPIDRQSRAFDRRSWIDKHLQYFSCLSELDEEILGDRHLILTLDHALPDADPDDSVLRRRVDRLRSRLARQLERLGEHKGAMRLYRRCQSPPARERCARILDKQQQGRASLAVCQQILADAASEQELEFALKFGARLAKKEQLPWPSYSSYQPPSERLMLDKQAECVELSAAACLAAQGDCHYVENSLMTGVLGLLIWEIVFVPVKGAFYHPFQAAPSDFYETDFVTRRRSEFAALWREIDGIDRLKNKIRATSQSKWGLMNPLVSWDRLSMDVVDKAMDAIPFSHWRVIFERCLEDLRNHCSGFPDLILFPEEGGYQLIEIKGPGDRLQSNQQRWMRFFQQHHIPHRVIQVEWR